MGTGLFATDTESEETIKSIPKGENIIIKISNNRNESIRLTFLFSVLFGITSLKTCRKNAQSSTFINF